MISERKLERRQSKYVNILKKDFGILSSNAPSEHLMVCNAGLVNSCKREDLILHFANFGSIEKIVMPPAKSYSFISFRERSSANDCYSSVNGTRVLNSINGPLYLLFIPEVPSVDDDSCFVLPNGIHLIENFIDDDEETILLKCLNLEDSINSSDLKNRFVKHYGYEFLYSCNNVDKKSPLEEKIPYKCDFLWCRLKEKGFSDVVPWIPDQLTVNHYQPGQGIPSHIDTHSAFDDPILSLSLGSDIVMEFKNQNGKICHALLPRKSLLIMSEEGRYAWKHGITPRKSDVIPSPEGGLTLLQRGVRTSFTFRHIRRGECCCRYPQFCDSQSKKDQFTVITDEMAPEIEENYVHSVYNTISDHFSETRHKPWPNVIKFVESMTPGSILIDVGCGNGKYFGFNKGLVEVGIDQSEKLISICCGRGFHAMVGSCLSLPVKSNIADGVICIAVIHHLATTSRRIQAIKEINRILKPGGKALIYTWAKDQIKKGKMSSYLKQSKKNFNSTLTATSSEYNENTHQEAPLTYRGPDEESNTLDLNLPVHSNRTLFEHKDLLVPWKLKYQLEPNGSVPTYLRYYHVFEENELEGLCSQISNLIIVNSYYDQGNWCVVFEKKS